MEKPMPIERQPTHPHPANLTHRQQRCYFTELTCDLVAWIAGKEWPWKVEVAIDEWTIHNPRLVKVGTQKVLAEDRVHHPGGQHPRGLAVDLLIYIDGEYITDGTHPIWKYIDERAREMDPHFGLGIHFNDANHLSYNE